MELAIYTSNFAQFENLIDSVRTFFHKEYTDIFICTPFFNSPRKEYACLHPFYLTFFKGTSLFLTLEDYIEYKDNIIGEKILFVDSNIQNNIPIDRSIFKECKFLTYDDNKQLIMVNNYAIR